MNSSSLIDSELVTVLDEPVGRNLFVAQAMDPENVQLFPRYV